MGAASQPATWMGAMLLHLHVNLNAAADDDVYHGLPEER